MYKYHEDFFPVLNFLHSLVAKLPGYPLGKQVPTFYFLLLDKQI